MGKKLVANCDLCGSENDLQELARWDVTEMACASCRSAYAEGIKDAVRIIEHTSFRWIGDKQQVSLDKRDLIQELKDSNVEA
jgi:hypothetical protein